MVEVILSKNEFIIVGLVRHTKLNFVHTFDWVLATWKTQWRGLKKG